MPADQKIVYSEPQGQKWPPYLVNFRGSVAERHVENLKVSLLSLREVGIQARVADAFLSLLQSDPTRGRKRRV